MHPALKFALDLGPLAVFFTTYQYYAGYLGGEDTVALTRATGALVVMTLVSLVVEYVKLRKLAVMPLFMAAAVTFFGGLTLLFDNDTFIKVKPTIVNVCFAVLLIGGQALGKPTLKFVLGSALPMTEKGWRILSYRWGFYFLFLAGLNEFVWRNFPTAFWVDFKVFGMFSCTLAFTFLQLPLMKREMIDEPEKP